MEIFSVDGLAILTRWVHFLAGITWIGLLYYFNFVQTPFMNEVDAGVKGVATRTLVPRALLWFRYSALVTWLAGVILLIINATAEGGLELLGGSYGANILSGAIFGTVMFLNVWLVIWPNQKIVIGSAEAVATGGQADPRAQDAARRGLLASRTNVLFSIPLLFFMGSAPHGLFLFTTASFGQKLTYWVVFGVLLFLIEGNALIGRTGAAKKPLEKIGSVILSGFVLFLILYATLVVVWGA